MRRKLFLLLLLILAIPVVAYIGFPWYAKPLLNLVLSGRNITIETLHLNRPDWNFIALRELSLNHADMGRISVVDADIHFSNLFSDYKISIKEITLAPFFTKKNIDKREESPLLVKYLPENFLPGIPTIDLTVHTIHIGRAADNQNVTLARLEKARLTNNRDGLDLSVILIGKKQHAVFLSVTHDNKFALAINPAAVDRAKLQLTGVLGESLEGITFKSAADGNFRQPIYFNTRLDEILGGFIGRFRSEMQFTFENLPLDEMLAHPVVSARGLVETDLKNPAREIKLRTATAFQFTMDRTDWEVNLATLPASGSDALSLEMAYDNRQHVASVVLPEPISISGTSGANATINTDAESVMALHYAIDGTSIASARLSDFNWNGVLAGDKRFNASLSADMNADGKALLALTDINNVQLSDFPLRFSAGIELHKDFAKLKIKDNTTVLAEKAVSNNITLNSVDMTIPPQEVVIHFGDISTNPISFTFNAKNVISNGYQVSPVRANGEAFLTKSQAQFTLINETTSLRKGGKGKAYNLPPYRVVGELQLPESTLTGVSLQLLNQCDKQLLSAKWAPAGLLAITAEHTFSEQDSLRRWLNLRDLTLDIAKGSLAASLEWDTGKANSPPRINVALNRANITGPVGTFDNVQLSLSTLETKSNGKYKLEGSANTMNIGAEVTNLVLRTDLTYSEAGFTARIEEVSGELLGGRAFIENEQWTSGQKSSIDVHLENLDLAELVKTQNIESVTTTGKLTGVIPITLSEDGNFALANGKLSDIDGGTIRYQSALAESEGLNDQLQLTLDVLKNFKYEVLETQLEYNDGNLVLKSNILGSNPDVAGGQKVDLNLNTEVNLKSAFEVMRLQAGLEAQVENLFSAGEESSLPFCQQPL